MERPRLDFFDNPFPDRDYTIEISCPEFTSVCPVTGQPDFGTLHLSYCPGAQCIELKSLKLYLQSFRNDGIYYEAVTNQILEDLVKCAEPKCMKLVSEWTPRGGISSKITCQFPATIDCE